MNQNLTQARIAKDDEFYTQLEDIIRELNNYNYYFENKVVYCNCDNPYKSNFVKYFVDNFSRLGLRGLHATCYSPKVYRQLSLFGDDEEVYKPNAKPYHLYITHVDSYNYDDLDAIVNMDGNFLHTLKGDGDFRSDECVSIVGQSDIVVTNPPFSLFKEFIHQMLAINIDVLVLGNLNVVANKSILKYFIADRLWLGINNGDMSFRVPDCSEERETRFWVDSDGQKWRSLGNVAWFTTLDHAHRHEMLPLSESYSSDRYHHYDDYDAIEVGKVADIPKDYSLSMGVPLTFLDKYNPEQFKLTGIATPRLNDILMYKRLIVVNRKPEK